MGRDFRYHLYREEEAEIKKSHREYLNTNKCREESESPYYQEILSYDSSIKEDHSISRDNDHIFPGKYTIEEINNVIRDLLTEWEETRDHHIYEAVRAYSLLGYELSDEPEGQKIVLRYD